MSVKFGDSGLPWGTSSDVQFGLPPQAQDANSPVPAAQAFGAPGSETQAGEKAELAEPAAVSPAEFASFASFGGSSLADEANVPVSPGPTSTIETRYLDAPLFDEFDAGDDSDDLVFGNAGPVLESPLPGELSIPLALPSFVEQFLSAEMEDDAEFEDFNEEDFDEEFDDDFEEEEDDFDYGEQELEGDGEESEEAGGLGSDAVPDADFED